MNGDWYPWGGAVNGNTRRRLPRRLAPPARHLRARRRRQRALGLVRRPTIDARPRANRMERYYPGAQVRRRARARRLQLGLDASPSRAAGSPSTTSSRRPTSASARSATSRSGSPRSARRPRAATRPQWVRNMWRPPRRWNRLEGDRLVRPGQGARLARRVRSPPPSARQSAKNARVVPSATCSGGGSLGLLAALPSPRRPPPTAVARSSHAAAAREVAQAHASSGACARIETSLLGRRPRRRARPPARAEAPRRAGRGTRHAPPLQADNTLPAARRRRPLGAGLDLPIVAINATLMRTGKMLIFAYPWRPGRPDPRTTEGESLADAGYADAYVFDPRDRPVAAASTRRSTRTPASPP